AVVGGTRERLAAAGLTERCDVIEGSFFEAIHAGGDTYSLKDILHDWNDEQSIQILKYCHKAMGGSGKLLVIERIIQPGNDPSPAKLIDITMLVLTGGQERTEQEYQSLLEAAGFRLEDIYSFDGVTHIIEAKPV
ncbi:MAG TPA: methyltransferase, partial [Anaerolineales bacterium]|nr:methyltransferase [Anaerolineales bacterium]